MQIINLLMMYSSLLPCNPVPLRPKYSPKHSVLKHPQLTFLPQCDQPSFVPIQNNMKIYSYLYLNIYTIFFNNFTELQIGYAQNPRK